MLNAAHHVWVTKKLFHSRLPKTVSNGIFLPFYLTDKTSDLHLTLEDFYKK